MFADLLTPATFDFFARYLLAGYIVIIVRARFVTGLRPKAAELLLEAVLFSLIVQAAGLFLGWTWSAAGGPALGSNLVFYLEILLLPAVLGVISGLDLSRGWNTALFRRLSAPVAHPAEKAHDFAFGYNRRAGLVIVTFNDGTVVRGLFGTNSLAATDDQRSDLYLECLYIEGENGAWQEPAPGRSGLISLSDVRSTEFLDEVS